MINTMQHAASRIKLSLRYNLLRQMLNPVTWVILGGGLFAVNAFTFFVAGILSQNNATMEPVWGFLPFVLAVMMPLLAMRGMAAERQMGAADWLSTKPMSPLFYDAGLLKSHMVLYGIWLLASLIFPVTLAFLGQPDWALIASGYLGALLLGMLFLAAAFFAANVARSLLGAFIGGVLVNLLLLFTAVEGVASLSPAALPAGLQNAIMNASPIHAFERLYRGFVMLPDVVWLVVLGYVFFLLGHMAHRARGVYPHAGRKISSVAAGLLAVGVVCHVFLSYSLDLTQEGRFKPSDAALDVVREVPAEKINITFFYSGGNNTMPPALRVFGRQALYYLQTLENSSEKISLKIVDPSVSAENELLARRTELEPHVGPDSSRSYLGMHIKTPRTDVTMPALQLARQHLFEFDLMNNIARLRHENTRRIGILTGLNMSDEKQRPDFLEMLMPFYRIDVLNHTNAMIPDENDLIIVFGGSMLEEKALYGLDQYIQRGGRVLFLVDPFWFSAPAGRLQALGNPDGNSGGANVFDLMAHLGLKFLPGEVLADGALGSPIKISEDSGVAIHPLWLTLRSGEINQDHPMTRNLSRISFAASGILHPQLPEGVALRKILTSSQKGYILPRRYMYEAEIENIASYYQGEPQEYIIAGEVAGDFPNFYDERPQKAQNWFVGEGGKWPERYIKPHTRDTSAEAKIFALADMDAFHPQLAAIGTTLQPANDNFNLMFNAVRYMLDEPEALRIHLRHEASQRPLIHLEQILTDLTESLSDEESSLVEDLMQVRANIADRRHDMTMKNIPEQRIDAEVYPLRIEEIEILQQLDSLRQRTFKAAQYFISIMTGLNVLGGFILLLVIGWFYKQRHFKRVSVRLGHLK